MDNTGKMRIVAEIDTSKADAAVKQLNDKLGALGATAQASVTQAGASFDKLAQSVLKSTAAKPGDFDFGDQLDKTGAAATRAAARLTGLKNAEQEYYRAQQAFKAAKQQRSVEREAAGQGNRPITDEGLAQYKREAEKAALKEIDALVSTQQAKELSGLQKIAAERKAAVSRLGGFSAEGDKKLGQHFDARELAAQAQAHKNIDDLIQKGQQKELTGAQKIELQRQAALKTLGHTEEHQKRINTHFDELSRKAGSQELASKIKNFVTNPIAAAGEAAEGAATAIGTIGTVAAAAAAVAVAAFVFVKSQADSLAASGLAIQNLAARTGLSAEQTQIFGKAAEYAGVDAEQLSIAVKKLNEDLAEGGVESAKIAANLETLGVRIKHTADGSVDAGATIDQAFRALQKVPDYYTRAALAQETFGKGSKAFLPLIENYDKLNARAREHLEVLTGGEIKAIDQYRQQVIDLNTAWDTLVRDFIKKPAVAKLSLIISAFDKAGKAINFLNTAGGALTFAMDGNAAAAGIKDVAAANAAGQSGEALAEAQRIQSEQKKRGLDSRFPEGRVASLKKELAGLDEKLKSEEKSAINFSTGTSTRDRDEARKKFEATQLQIKSKRAELELAEITAGAEKKAASALLSARNQREEAETRQFGGLRALEEANRRERIKAETTVGSEGKEFYRPTAAVGAEFDKKLIADTAVERRKEFQERRQAEQKLADEKATLAIDAAKREGQIELDALRVKAANGEGNLREIEDAELASKRDTINKVAKLETEAIKRRTQFEKDQFALQRSFTYSSDPATAEGQRRETAARVNIIGDGGRASAEKVEKDRATAVIVAGQELERARQERDHRSREATERENDATATDLLAHQREFLHQREAAEFDSLALVQANTLSAQLKLNQARLGIEVRYVAAQEDLDLQLIERRRQLDIKAAQDHAREAAISATEAAAAENAINVRAQQEKVLLVQDTEARIAEIRRQTAIKSAQDIIDSTRRVFDEIKSQTESILDIAFGNSKHKGQDILAQIKKESLKAVKETIATQVAIAGTAAATGQPVGQQTNTAGRGLAGLIQRITGVKPVFNGGLSPEQTAQIKEAGKVNMAGTKEALKTLKIEKSGALGDVKLTQDGAVPVYVINGGGGQGQNQPSSGADSIFSGTGASGGGSAASGPSGAQGGGIPNMGSFFGKAAGLLGVLGSLGAMFKGGASGAAGVAGGGASAVSESIQYAGGGVESLGGSVTGAGGASPGGAGGLGGFIRDPGIGGATGGATGGGGGFMGLLKSVFGLGGGNGGIAGGKGGLLGMLKGGLGNFDMNMLGGAFHKGNTVGLLKNFSQLGKSNLAGMAGIGLGLDGLRRGGVGGALETAAGGALTGFKYGGPIGAAIGLAVGAAAGVTRMFWKTKTEETKDRIKKLYGLKVNNETAMQIAEIAKNQYGGSINAALQSGEVQKLLSLYSETTGGNYGVVGPVAAGLGYTGGKLQQAGSYVNGKLLGFSSSLSSVTPLGGTLGSPTFDKFGQNPTKISLSLDGNSSAAFLQGQTVNALNSSAGAAAVSNANLSASSASQNRLQQLAALSSPSTVIS